jgi:hypothetical protein
MDNKHHQHTMSVCQFCGICDDAVNATHQLCVNCSECYGCGENALIEPGQIQIRSSQRGKQVLCTKCNGTKDYHGCDLCKWFTVTGLDEWINMGYGVVVHICLHCNIENRIGWAKKGYKNVTSNYRC